jgi:hypothetical protein
VIAAKIGASSWNLDFCGSSKSLISLTGRLNITLKFCTCVFQFDHVYVFALLRHNANLFRVENIRGSVVGLSRALRCDRWNSDCFLFVLSLSISAFVVDRQLNGSFCCRPRGGVGSEQLPSSDSDDYSAIHQQHHSGHGQSLDSCAVPKVQVSGPSNADESASIINGWVNNATMFTLQKGFFLRGQLELYHLD